MSTSITSAFSVGQRVQLLSSEAIMTVQVIHYANQYLTCGYEGPNNEKIIATSPISEFRAVGKSSSAFDMVTLFSPNSAT